MFKKTIFTRKYEILYLKITLIMFILRMKHCKISCSVGRGGQGGSQSATLNKNNKTLASLDSVLGR